MFALVGLFLAAFAAATLIPAQSEAVLVAMILSASHPIWLLLTIATFGNVLGSAINWAMGRFLIRFADRRWFPFSQAQMGKATGWYSRWGHWSLLASWVPVIGDPLTLVAGVLREPFWRFALIVTLAKGGRYLVLAWVTLALS
ncbi:MAG: YqaA family protein [Pseudotabrizicola sp.]|uniref:YqaA family protein n=1 Tax=Pseudotabrizicola sp. TaxID=2939647 RepID=UPI002726470B|nr:YqaA family protein [Pseudotabrizicola sp.]MDO8885101.1 YqaA family protein [Pseudotabrizicola sp.]MDP2081014.1 YqaA family protein [Pseudotabrizicola sp.]MDZ7573988.1 YqaA family protein [Pseudotabrizicola sp.]